MKKNKIISDVQYPPGPSTTNFFPIFKRNPLKVLSDISYNYGDISHFKFGKQQHVYFLNNPDYIERILVTNNKNFAKRRGLKGKGLPRSKQLLGNGLIFSEGEFHDHQRRLIQPIFHHDRIKSYGKIVTDCVTHMCQRWKDGSTLDIHKEMMHVTLEIICKSVLGYDANNEGEANEITKAIFTASEYHQRHQMLLGRFIEKIPFFPSNKHHQQALDKLNSMVYDIIKQNRQPNITRDAPSMLTTLLQNQDTRTQSGDNKKIMTDLQLRDEMMTMIIGGHEIIANAFTWTFYLISQHPNVEDKISDELESILGATNRSSSCSRNAARIPTVEDIPKLQYVEKVFRESLRLYPSAWNIIRRAINDYLIGKYIIPSGSLIIMSQYVMHHDTRFFPEPNKFLPERWTEEFKAQLPRFAYFPFGGGPRSCMGEAFAWMEGVLLIATIVQQWKMMHSPNHRVEFYHPIIDLRPKYGMYMNLKCRV